MDESLRRHWAAAEALELPWGGLSAVVEATGLSMTTIRRGVRELQGSPKFLSALPLGDEFAIRAEGVKHWPPSILRTSLSDLEKLVDPVTRGDPESPLRWTCKSTRNLADA